MTDEPKYDPFADDPAPPDKAVARATKAAVDRIQLIQQMRGGGSWFFWIAGVSIVNAVVAITGGEWRFLFSLTLSDMLTQGVAHMVEQGDIAEEAAAGWRIATGAISLFAVTVFVVLGVFARKGGVWAFVVGLVLYGMDAALTLFIGEWLNLAFHAWALVGLFSGVQAARKLRALFADETAQADVLEFAAADFEP